MKKDAGRKMRREGGSARGKRLGAPVNEYSPEGPSGRGRLYQMRGQKPGLDGQGFLGFG